MHLATAPQPIRKQRRVQREPAQAEQLLSLTGNATQALVVLARSSEAEEESIEIKPIVVARMEQEMVILERDLKAIESGYGENMLNLTLARAPCPKAAEQSRRVRVFERPLREDSC